MIVLDTNVLSELMKGESNVSVLDWTSKQAATSLYVTAVTQAEVLFGIGLMPAGKRRTGIEEAANAMFSEDFQSRVLTFGSDAATEYARIAVSRRQLGRPISQFDAQIAAICRSTGASLATRNVSDFEHCGVTLVDPWQA